MLPKIQHTAGEPICNTEFEISGINHLALVCSDMQQTYDFYTNVLGMPLIECVALTNNRGYHFFFGLGNGDSLAFFWFADAPPASPGVSAAGGLPGRGNLTSGVGSMNHVAFNVPVEKMREYRDRLVAKGVDVTEILNHDDSPAQLTSEMHDDVWISSMYFFDPDGIMLEFACWTNAARALAEDQRSHVAVRA